MAPAGSIAFAGRWRPRHDSIDDAELTFGEGPDTSGRKAAHLVVSDLVEVDLPLDALVDPVEERKRLTKQQTKLEKEVGGLEKRLGSSGFLQKATADVVEETKKQLQEKQEQLDTINRSLAELDS